MLLIATRIVPGIAALALAATGLWLWSRHRRKPSGLATSHDLAPLLPAEITAKARDLRPSLADCKRPGNPPRRHRIAARQPLALGAGGSFQLGGRLRRHHGAALR